MKKILTLAIFLITVVGCKKEDNSGRIVFWYGQSTAEQLFILQVDNLKYYIDGTLVGSTASDVYFTTAPDCGSTGTITVDIDLGELNAKDVAYVVTGDGDTIWDGTISVSNNTCNRLELPL